MLIRASQWTDKAFSPFFFAENEIDLLHLGRRINIPKTSIVTIIRHTH